ncbi:uncharacterized protein [Mytilus edulis]|uniref:uncharacterized protein n=1 Tax=Mytilus edulis TaxID=6550 RepID=UPI0039F09BF0
MHVLLNSARIMFHIVVALSMVQIRGVLSCNVHLCLTWQAQKENITFKCRVSQLQWKVYFYNPENDEQGHCLSPIPFSTCFSSHNNITQDLKTNTTLLVIHREVDSRLDGSWKCIHGTKRDEAIVNVTVIHKVKVKRVTYNEDCSEENMAWTFVGGIICFILLLVTRTILKISSDNKNDCYEKLCKLCKRKHICGSCCVFSSKLYYAIWILCTGILFVIGVVSVPFFTGKWMHHCTDKHYFALFGCFVVLFLGICWSFPKKEVSLPKPPSADMAEVDDAQRNLCDNN